MLQNAGVINIKRVVHIGTNFLKEGVLSVLISLSFLKITSLYNGIKLVQSSVKSGTCLSKWSLFNHFRKHLKRIQDLPERNRREANVLRPLKIFSILSSFALSIPIL